MRIVNTITKWPKGGGSACTTPAWSSQATLLAKRQKEKNCNAVIANTMRMEIATIMHILVRFVLKIIAIAEGSIKKNMFNILIMIELWISVTCC